MKILVAPLNWGLGHASRCVPLVQRFLDEGHEVILGGDGESLTLLRKHFPKLRYVYLAPLNLRYSAGSRQVWAMVKAMPHILSWAIKDHAMLKAVLREEHIDRVVSDNRFGLYSKETECIYITHQLHIMLPKGWRWAETIASRLHARIYMHYNKVWVPDYEDFNQSLAGELSHIKSKIQNLKSKIEYIGPLSRFENHKSEKIVPSEGKEVINHQYDVVAVLSGLEPHRTQLEKEIITRYSNQKSKIKNLKSILIVQGLMHRPGTRIKRANITIVPYMADDELAQALCGATHVIARSGYSTIMDFEALGMLAKAELIPTPGQPEQEYLAAYNSQKSA